MSHTYFFNINIYNLPNINFEKKEKGKNHAKQKFNGNMRFLIKLVFEKVFYQVNIKEIWDPAGSNSQRD